jgi:23S rRNA-/tRNA-specific pseudouridylate synthase
MAHLGHPILGDDKYGDRAFNRERQAQRQVLQAVKLEPGFPDGSFLSYLNGRVFEARILPELSI